MPATRRSAMLLAAAALAATALAGTPDGLGVPLTAGDAARFTGGGSAFVPINGTGWNFRPAQNVVVTDLGVHDAGGDGLAAAHTVGIFRSSGQPVISGVVPAGIDAPLRGTSRIVDVPDVTLFAGLNYYISTDNLANDAVALGNGAVAFDPRIEWTGPGNNVTPDINSLWIPGSGPAGNLGPTFGIRGLTSGFLALDVTGFGPHAFSSNATGWAFTAEADLLVTELGFYDWQQDGLAEPHAVGIFDADTSALVASATIPAGTTAALRGATRTVPITPVILDAGRSYYITASNNTADRFLSGAGALDFVPFVTWDGAGFNATNDITSAWTTGGGAPGNHGPNFTVAWSNPDDPDPSTRIGFGSFYVTPDHAVGWLLEPESDLRLTELGFHDAGYDGLAADIPVGIFRADDGSLVTEAVIPAGTTAPLRGDARVVPIDPVTLTAYVPYYILAGNMGADPVSRDPVDLVYDPRIEWIAHAEATGNDIDDPVQFTAEGWRGFHGPVFTTDCDGPGYDQHLTRISDNASFEDISVTGTVLETIAAADDAGEVLFLPFPVEFYGDRYDAVTVSTNGYITFGTEEVGAFPSGSSRFPDPTDGPQAVIAPYWADWDTDQNGEVEYRVRGVSGSRRLIIQWTDVEHFAFDGERATFQVTLFEDSDCFRFGYGEDSLQILTPKIGYANAGGTDGMTLERLAPTGGWIICPSCDLPDLCPGDANGNGQVSFTDLLAVLSEWGPTSGCATVGGRFSPADFDRDCDVDFDDLLVVLGAFGPCP